MLRAVRCRVVAAGWRAAPAPLGARRESTLPLPPPPAPPSIPSPIVEAVAGEPSLRELGLGGWSPSGIAQQMFETLHASCGAPWWASIFVGTVIVRALLSPAFVMSQRATANLYNHTPRMSYLQGKVNAAKHCGDQIKLAHYSQQLALFMRDNKINPIKNAVAPLVQLPFFLSIFFGLRSMAQCPVESMTVGGALWFPDLTVPDQYYLLPVLTSLTLWASIETNLAGSTASTTIAKYAMRAIPVVIFPFTINFPSAILCYWLSTNALTLAQAGLLRSEAVRRYLKIPEKMKFDPKDKDPNAPKGFVAKTKRMWTDMKSSKTVESRFKVDERNFVKAGRGPLVKTYSYNPKTVEASSKNLSR